MSFFSGLTEHQNEKLILSKTLAKLQKFAFFGESTFA